MLEGSFNGGTPILNGWWTPRTYGYSFWNDSMNFRDAVSEYSYSVGLGDFVMSGAVPGFITFVTAGMTNGEVFDYSIQHQTTIEWEVGSGTWHTSTNSFTRNVVTQSSAGPSNFVNFTSGQKIVVLTLSQRFMNKIGTLAAKKLLGAQTAGEPQQLGLGVGLDIASNNLSLVVSDTTTVDLFLSGTALFANAITTGLALFTPILRGIVPSSGGGTVNFLRADGVWATPPGTGGGGAPINAEYLVRVSDATLTSERVVIDTATVIADWSTAAQVKFNVPVFTSSAIGVVPSSGGGTVNFLRADGAWTVPPGTGGGGGAPADVDYLVKTASAGLSAERVVMDTGSVIPDWTVSGEVHFDVKDYAVTNTKLAIMSSPGIKGSYTTGPVPVSDLTGTQVTTLILTQFDNFNQGVVPGSGGGTTNFLRADKTWAAPPSGILTVTDSATIDLTITGSDLTAFVKDASITNSKLAPAAAFSFRGNPSGTAATPQDMSTTQATALINLFTGTLSGAVPGGSADDTTKFLRGDGQWQVPPGTGGAVTGISDTATIDLTLTSGTLSADVKDSSITNGKLVTMPHARVKGNMSGVTAQPSDLTQGDLVNLLGIFSTSSAGLAPISPGGTANFLRADGSWAAPSSGAPTDAEYIVKTAHAGLSAERVLLDTGTVAATWTNPGQVLLYVPDTGITNAKLANATVAQSFKGNPDATPSYIRDMTGTEATALLSLFTSSLKGLAPASGGGTTNYLRADGTWTVPPGTGGAGAAADVQIFTSNGTWTKPTNKTIVRVLAIGGGGGGGSGRKGAAATGRGGGGGGGGGAMVDTLFQASSLGSTESVVVGGAGTGGVAQLTQTTDGNPGTAGGNSSFGSSGLAVAPGGAGGGGGVNAAGGSVGSGGIPSSRSEGRRGGYGVDVE